MNKKKLLHIIAKIEREIIMNMNNHRYLANCINAKLEECGYTKIHLIITKSLKEIYIKVYDDNHYLTNMYSVTTLNASVKLIDKLIKELYQNV